MQECGLESKIVSVGKAGRSADGGSVSIQVGGLMWFGYYEGTSRCDFFSASSKSSCVKGLSLLSVCCVCGCEPPDFMDCERRPTLDEGPGLMDSWVCWRDSPTAGCQLLSPVLWSRGIGDPTDTTHHL